MHRYAIYGTVLESEIPFPELSPATTGTARWRVRQRAELPEMVDARELGVERIYADVHARLYAHRDGWRITVDDTGAFDLLADGEILVAPRQAAWDDFVRGHLTGRVLATAMYREGILPFHASAVATREGVVAFLAPKRFGKSSLAAAFVQADTPLVTDDTLPVELGTPPMAWPGVHTLRVQADTRTALALTPTGEESHDGKRTLTLPQSMPLITRPQPLAAMFLLAPFKADTVTHPVARAPFPAAIAAAAIVAHIKCGEMLGKGAAAAMLAGAANVVRLVPVSQLAIIRDLDRLPEVVATVLDWYGGPAR